MNKNNGSFIIKKKYNKRVPYYLCIMACIVPICVMYHKSLTLTKLEDGVRKDVERIKQKGKKFSDIPKSF